MLFRSFVCENERDGAHMMASAQKQIELPVEDLRKFVGTYDVVDLGNRKHKAVVELSDNRLLVDYDDEGKQPVTPFTATRFSLAGTWIEFTPQPSGGMEMLIRYVEGDERGPRR